MRFTSTIALLALVLAGCAREGEEAAQQIEMGAAEMAALTAAFDQVRTAFEQAYETGDATALAGLYTDDGTQLPPLEALRQGKAAIEEAYRLQFGQTASRDIVITALTRGASGDIAYEIGTFTITAQVTGQAEPLREDGKYLVVSMKQADGSWKILAHSWNTNAPATPPGT
jgi:uncharacterized protein (TIGR02246 family)